MNKPTILIFGSVVAAAMAFGVVIGATGLVKAPVAAFAATASPTPTPKSNEATAHESGETAAREAAENSGQGFGPGGPGGGHPNENAAHESGESAAREAAETAGVKPTTTP
jgi:hypothetical protein